MSSSMFNHNSCQKNRPLYRAKGGLLKPLSVATGPWESISMDFIQGLPMSHGFNAILTIVDRFSKMTYFVPTRKTVSATEVATVVFDHVYRMWGLPTHILSDRDSRFTGNFWRALFRLSETDLTRGLAYHHETDGQTERVNLAIEEYLRHFVSANQKDWPKHITMGKFKYNSSVHSATGFAPFFLATGQTPRAPAWFINPEAWSTESKVPTANDFIKGRQTVIEVATKGLTLAQSRYKKQEDVSRRRVRFEIGEHVWLQLRPEQYHNTITRKFAPRYAGPYKILELILKGNLDAVSVMLDVPK